MNSPQPPAHIDELLDRAFKALNSGERDAAHRFAEQVLAIDRDNADAEDLLAAPADSGEIRRLSIMFVDLVDSTALSTRVEPETYRVVVGRYKEEVRGIVERYEGHVASIKGDGLLIVFGHPRPHENDVQRAVHAGLDITRQVAALSQRVKERFGFTVAVRVGVHRGVVYLDLEQDDVYGLAANFAARVSGLAPPGTVVVSAAVEPLVAERFELRSLSALPVKGIEEPVEHYEVLGEHVDPGRAARGPLVGRHREQTHIQQSWQKACAGALTSPGLALHGEPGIGKSRLCSTATELADQSDAVVLKITGSPFHSNVGLYPVRRLLERRCGITAGTPLVDRIDRMAAELRDVRMDSTAVLPLLAPVLAIPASAGYQASDAGGPELYKRIAAAVHDYLLACLKSGPALIVAEDLHWFDDDTHEVLRSLLEEDSGLWLILMTSREEQALPEHPRVERFLLGTLSDDEADELITALAPDMGVDSRAAVSHRCGGVPLFIEEVVAKLQSQATDTTESGVPESLYEALFARLGSSRDAVRVVEAAAVIGGLIDRWVLSTVVGLGEDELDRAVAELCGERVLVPERSGWQFRHELLRGVAAEVSPPTQRRRLHGRIADAMLEATAGINTDWPRIADHYERAERHESAASAYQKAAGPARRRGALNEARHYLGRAIAQLELAPPGPMRDHREIALRQRRGLLYYAAEGSASENAAADFERCLHLCGTEPTDDLFETLTALYGYYAIRADLSRAHAVLDATRTGVAKGQLEVWPTITAGFGMIAWYRGEFDDARIQLETAVARLHHVGRGLVASWFMANEPIASVHTHLALARHVQGDLRGADQELDETARRCEEVGLPQGPFSQDYARQMEVLIRLEAGDVDRAAAVAAALTADARVHNFESWIVLGEAQQAVVEAVRALASPTLRGELDHHITTVTGLVDGWRASGLRSLITFYDAVLARLLLAAGRPDDARARVDIALALAAETGMRFYDAELLRIRADTRDGDDRRRELAAALDLARDQGALIFQLRCALHLFELDGADPAATRAQLVEAAERLPDNGGWPELARARVLLG